MKKILALVTALSFAVPVISDAAFAAPPGSTKPAPGKPGGGGGGGGHKPGRPGGGGGGGGGHKPRPPGGGGGHKPRPPGNGGGHRPRPPGNGHKPRPPGNGHRPRPPGNGHRPRPPGNGRPPSWTKPRPNQWYWRGRWINRIRASSYFYPRGYTYRHWSVGAILPALFLTSTYFYDDVGPLGLELPPPGYRWVRYGPDLLLVNLRTGSVEEVAYGVFY